MIHLADPIRALKNIRSVIKKGEFICANPFMKTITLDKVLHPFDRPNPTAALLRGRPKVGDVPTYWIPTKDCLREMIYKAGFDRIEKVGEFTLHGISKTREEVISPHVVFKNGGRIKESLDCRYYLGAGHRR